MYCKWQDSVINSERRTDANWHAWRSKFLLISTQDLYSEDALSKNISSLRIVKNVQLVSSPFLRSKATPERGK